jgi:hypothetical protein
MRGSDSADARITYKEEENQLRESEEETSSSSGSSDESATAEEEDDPLYDLAAFLHQWMLNLHGNGTRPPTSRYVKEITNCAPGWTGEQIIEALRQNYAERGGRPEHYSWFKTVLTGIFEDENAYRHK